MLLKKNDVILFQGDSITDCSRNKEDAENLGCGYAQMAASRLLAEYPELDLTFYNRGVNGDTNRELTARWQEDCLDLKPTVLSILFGVNDCCRRFTKNTPTTREEYKEAYRNLILQAKKQNPELRVIMLEPFMFLIGEDKQVFRTEDLIFKIEAAREVAYELADIYIPTDGIFSAACLKQKAEYWSRDGVHPTYAGHALIAKHWVDAVVNYKK